MDKQFFVRFSAWFCIERSTSVRRIKLHYKCCVWYKQQRNYEAIPVIKTEVLSPSNKFWPSKNYFSHFYKNIRNNS